MTMTELIIKKRDGGELTREEIYSMVEDYTKGAIPDYQMSAMLMAIIFRGMSAAETDALTLAMLASGDSMDLSAIDGIKADKHSTGGVGDKTSLVLCPLLAECGVKMAKMSGRGLGHTGGTVDKLESFPGLNTSLSEEEFFAQVRDIGLAISGQTGEVCPADKKLYALRDVTGTVESVALIASSIMSKKLASGADIIVLDVKCGDGAFMKTERDAEELARELCRIGRSAGRSVAAVITDMDRPLGRAIGNALEVREAMEVLRGEQQGELLELCLALGSQVLMMAKLADSEAAAREMLLGAISSGRAIERFAAMIRAQGGKLEELPEAPVVYEVKAAGEGYIAHIETERCGRIVMLLGGGRATKEDSIDSRVGIVLRKTVGDRVDCGSVLAEIHAADEPSALRAADALRECFSLSSAKVEIPALIKKIV